MIQTSWHQETKIIPDYLPDCLPVCVGGRSIFNRTSGPPNNQRHPNHFQTCLIFWWLCHLFLLRKRTANQREPPNQKDGKTDIKSEQDSQSCVAHGTFVCSYVYVYVYMSYVCCYHRDHRVLAVNEGVKSCSCNALTFYNCATTQGENLSGKSSLWESLVKMRKSQFSSWFCTNHIQQVNE